MSTVHPPSISRQTTPRNDHQTTVTAKSSELPVTLAQAKEHLRVAGDEQDEYIAALIEAAVEYCEHNVARALRVSHTVTQKYRQWPCSPISFDRHPVKSIASVKYYDTSGTLTTVTSSNYRLLQSTEGASVLEFDSDYSLPSLETRGDAVEINYSVGYDDIASVPARAKHAIKLIVGHWYSHPEAVNIGNITSEVPMAATALLGLIDWGSYR